MAFLVRASILSFLLVIGGGVSAQDFSSTNFTVSHPVIFPGGYSTSDNFRLHGVVSQTAIGTSTATTFDVYSGFLYFSDETAATAPSAGAGSSRSSRNLLAPVPPCPSPRVDFNGDCKVDIIDLSILLFRWERTGPEIAPYDIDGSGRIDLVDASILFYHWTG